MAEGQIIAEGTPDDIGANQDVIDAYLGSHTDHDFFDDLEGAAGQPLTEADSGEQETS